MEFKLMEGFQMHASPQFFLHPAHHYRKNKKLLNSSRQHNSPRWVQLEPELEEALVPRKLSVSPLESWLSLRYSLPPLLESAKPQGDTELLEEKLLPPNSVPAVEDGEGTATPMRCKNVLEIRRRKMNRHKYKKLQKRTKFLKRRVLEGRGERSRKNLRRNLRGYGCELD